MAKKPTTKQKSPAKKTSTKKPTDLNRDNYFETRLAILKQSMKKQQKNK